VILLVRYAGEKYLGYELIPTTWMGWRVTIAQPEEAQQILDRIEAQPAVR